METGSIRRQNDHLRLYPNRLVADKGYTSSTFRKYLYQKNIRCTIPQPKNKHYKGAFNKQIYRKCNIVERLINRLKQFRRIATRYEKRAANFSALITLASIFLFSNFAYRL
jgi:transposase